jgi:hypothetical protein
MFPSSSNEGSPKTASQDRFCSTDYSTVSRMGLTSGGGSGEREERAAAFFSTSAAAERTTLSDRGTGDGFWADDFGRTGLVAPTGSAAFILFMASIFFSLSVTFPLTSPYWRKKKDTFGSIFPGADKFEAGCLAYIQPIQ